VRHGADRHSGLAVNDVDGAFARVCERVPEGNLGLSGCESTDAGVDDVRGRVDEREGDELGNAGEQDGVDSQHDETVCLEGRGPRRYNV
jgi:hypothetical protein